MCLFCMTVTLFSGHTTASQIKSDDLPIQTSISPTDITVNNIHGSSNHYVFIKAYLSNNHGKPLSNKEIIFKIDGDPHTYLAITNTNGYALLYYYMFQNTGVYTIKAEFQGDDTSSPSNSESKLTVE